MAYNLQWVSHILELSFSKLFVSDIMNFIGNHEITISELTKAGRLLDYKSCSGDTYAFVLVLKQTSIDNIRPAASQPSRKVGGIWSISAKSKGFPDI